MSANTYTTDDIVSNLDLIGHLPLANATFTAAKIIKLADRELQLPLMKQILQSRGGYYLAYEDYAVSADGLYVIPSRAIIGALANVELVQTPTVIQVDLIVESEQFSTESPTSTSYGGFMKANYVQILPIPNLGVARLWYYRRTSTLVTVDSCAVITAVNANVISVSSYPSTMAIGTVIDAVGDQPPFNIFGTSTITGIAGTDITLSDTIESVGVGDWLCLQDQTCVPQIPVEYRVLLEQRVAVKLYELQGYLDKMKAAKNSLEELEKDTLSLISPRIKSKTKVINPINGGFLNNVRANNFPPGRNN